MTKLFSEYSQINCFSSIGGCRFILSVTLKIAAVFRGQRFFSPPLCLTGCGRSLSQVRPGVSPADRVTVDTVESSTATWTRYTHLTELRSCDLSCLIRVDSMLMTSYISSLSTCPVSNTWTLSGRPPEAPAPSPLPAAAEPN